MNDLESEIELYSDLADARKLLLFANEDVALRWLAERSAEILFKQNVEAGSVAVIENLMSLHGIIQNRLANMELAEIDGKWQ